LRKDRVMSDSIQPIHYKSESIQPIDLIEALNLSFSEGNIIKYVARWRKKNGVEDLYKAKWYLERLIKSVEAQNSGL
jgi:hypothetical protein